MKKKKDKPVKSISENEGDSSVDVATTVEELRKQVDETKDQYLRTLADMENIRKRTEREKEEFTKFVSERILRDLLSIVDSLDQALTSAQKQTEGAALHKGVELIAKQLLDLLAREGVQRIESIGKVFDPHQHEAIAEIKAVEGQADGTIVEEFQVGYLMHGKLLRPAMVKIARASEKTDQEES